MSNTDPDTETPTSEITAEEETLKATDSKSSADHAKATATSPATTRSRRAESKVTRVERRKQ